MSSVEEIEGLGPASAEKLRAAGIETHQALWDRCRHEADRQTLAELTRIHPNKLGRWVCHADLLRVPSVTGRHAGLLFDLDITSVSGLAGQESTDLALRAAEANALDRRLAHPPSLALVRRWVDEARQVTQESDS